MKRVLLVFLSLSSAQILLAQGSTVTGSKYFVSYWENSTANTVLVNGESGTDKATLDNWTYYEVQVVSATSIVVAGVGIID